MNGTEAPDKVDAAIAAAAEPTPIEMIAVRLTIASTGRPAQIVVPKDLSDDEMLEIISWFTSRLRVQLREQSAASALWTPPSIVGRDS